MTAVRHVRAKQRGVALLIMLVLVAMGVLYFVVNGASVIGMKNERQEITRDALMQAKQALIGYAATYRDGHADQMFGYLPCPDMNGDGSADLTGCGGSGVTVVGLLPYKQLGLPNNLDAEGNCLWYAVSGSFKAAGSSLPVMNWDTQGQIEIRDSSGSIVMQPGDANGGAAAVVFSVGVPIGAQSRTAPTDTRPCGATDAAHADVVYTNYVDVDPAGADPARSQPFPSDANVTLRVVQGSRDSGTDNDMILSITPREVFTVITKRSDLAGIINAGIGAIRMQLEGSLPLATPATGNNLPTANPFTYPSDDYSFYRNWANNFRYRTCNPSDTYCFNIDSDACDGVLLFAGQSATGSPRASGADPSAYFEDAGTAQAYSLTTGTTFTSSGSPIAYAADNRPVDIVQCLAPQPESMQEVSFADDLARFDITQSAGTGMVRRSTDTDSVRLGNRGSSATFGWGCFWYPQVFPMRDGLRAYFSFVVPTLTTGTNTGSFTFALIDANPSLNSTPTDMCGGAGEYLGYAGVNGVTTAPLNAPKIAIEFDKVHDVGRDPEPASDHAGFVYWGGIADDATTKDDDNIHGRGGITAPLNPDTAPGLIRNPIVIGATYFVRLDIARTHDVSGRESTVILKAYVSRDIASPASCPLSDLSDDLTALCLNPETAMNYGYLTDTIPITDVGGSAAMRQVYLGFTTGQDGPSQRVVVSDFAARERCLSCPP